MIMIPNYEKAIYFENHEILWTDKKTGRKKPWKVNYKIVNLGRRFHGGYDWQGSNNFRKMVRQDSNTWKNNFWGRSLHGLGKTHEEIFSFFTDFMNDKDRFNFSTEGIDNLVDFWSYSFRKQLKEIGEEKLASKYSDDDLEMVYYCVIAKTVQGILDEQLVFDGLSKMFEDENDVEVEWGTIEDDFRDCDIIIKKKGHEWHRVSVKSKYSFTYKCINQLRSGSDFGKTNANKNITVYCDENLNRLFFKRYADIPYKIIVTRKNDMIEEMIDKWGLDE